MYHLMKDQSKMQRAVEEIDAAWTDGKLSDPITDREARAHLPYMNAAIKEALRMHPAVGMLLERVVPVGGAIICGKQIPSGTIVGINPWVVHYDPEVFPEPETFRPERWLKEVNSEAHFTLMERSFFAFGAGSRVCLGRHLSMIEMRKIVPQLLRKFEIRLQDSEAEWHVHTAWFTPQKMPSCTMTKR